jgi:hypothetical protein
VKSDGDEADFIDWRRRDARQKLGARDGHVVGAFACLDWKSWMTGDLLVEEPWAGCWIGAWLTLTQMIMAWADEDGLS